MLPLHTSPAVLDALHVTYRYDELDRLTEACWSATSCPGGPPAAPVPCIACVGGLLSRPAATTNPPPGETFRTYTYDPVGNRLTEASDAGATNYAYDAADRLTTVTAPGNVVTNYTFDDNGNQTAAGARTFTYDFADRLKTATVGNTTETYTYAGDGVRLSASTGSQAAKTTKSLWDRSFGLPQLAIERNGSDALLRSYRYGLDLISQAAGSKTYYYHHDGLGSVADVTGSTGTSLSWTEYYPYGLVRQAGKAPGGNGAPAVDPFLFTGEQLDTVTGLYHLRARQYDPATGRFGAIDPVAQRKEAPYLSSYVYANDRPITHVDPSGLDSGGLCAAVQGALGIGGQVQICIVATSDFELGVTITPARVAGTPNLSVSGGVQWFDGESINDLGQGFDVKGGSVGVGVGLGGEVVTGVGRCGQPVSGVNASAQLTLKGPPAEAHFGASYTFIPLNIDLGRIFGDTDAPCPPATGK